MHHYHRLAVLGLFCAVPVAAAQSDPIGQVVLDNQSTLGAELYVDEDYACYAPAHDSCVAEIPAGRHVARIRFDDDDYILSDPFDVPAGQSVTLPVQNLLT